MNAFRVLLLLAIVFSVFIVVNADIVNPALLQALVDAARWLDENAAKLDKSVLEGIVIAGRWFWQLVLDNADQIGKVWAEEFMPGVEDAEVAAEQMADFIRETLGPILEAIA
jgi:hypothetical protein